MGTGILDSGFFRRRAAGLGTELLGRWPAVHLARLAARGRIPILAYHEVSDPSAFASHLDIIQEQYCPVFGAEVMDASRGTRHLPRRPIWITFDDGHLSVFEHALPLLLQRGIPATAFVCPGLVDTTEPFWWQVLDAAIKSGNGVELDGKRRFGSSIISQVKKVPDNIRRSLVARAASELADSGTPVTVAQATTRDLESWIAAGLELGNHTWSHPCLDTCDEAEQRRQIVSADNWLHELIGKPTLFAYPNGNATIESQQLLTHLGYGVAALFDHRMAKLGDFEVSRLRIDADASVRRFAAIASGAHSSALQAAAVVGLAGESIRLRK